MNYLVVTKEDSKAAVISSSESQASLNWNLIYLPFDVFQCSSIVGASVLSAAQIPEHYYAWIASVMENT